MPFPSSRSSPGAFCPPWRAGMEKEVTLSFEMLAQSALQPSLQHLLLKPHPPSAEPQLCICSPRVEREAEMARNKKKLVQMRAGCSHQQG